MASLYSSRYSTLTNNSGEANSLPSPHDLVRHRSQALQPKSGETDSQEVQSQIGKEWYQIELEACILPRIGQGCNL